MTARDWLQVAVYLAVFMCMVVVIMAGLVVVHAWA